ncbi:putative metal-dependent hydrolase [Nocardioides luteus]|uniref:Metal-dependent hydrolase n=1 Tax=Nocardioides luteus TaxID=1844 RepID=A0ABQ5SWQ8_9ACTN|nr:metal-dependent hydrolase [Nocardioides luteus]MDR7312361.1 putative metal-dependent hydrolase [Nocardioides luteus]GGR57979.1 metal-dependent hydrolase [Nocardioides luteus]GLJ68608.1 metal-dependent hydrolase [Nocardioides luteus]
MIKPSIPSIPIRPRAKSSRGHEPAKVALHPRNVKFDWSRLPLVWIPGEVFASHYVSVLHLLLPEGERWFVKVFSEILPLIEDDQLREDVIGFIGQEGVHAAAHQEVQDYFTSNGLDVRPFTAEIEALFRKILGDRDLTGRAKEEWLIERAAIIAGLEHLTAVLGNWVLNSPELDAAGADETMLDLLRWHGAEEVEHRNVAYDVFQHVDGRYLRRVRTYLLGGSALLVLWWRGVGYLMANDPTEPDPEQRPRPGFLKLLDAERRGLVPGAVRIGWATWKYFLPGYDPAKEGSTAQAVSYLAKSPAALRADALAEAQ